MNQKKPFYKKAFRFIRDLVFIIMLKPVVRHLILYIKTQKICSLLRKAVEQTGKPVVIYVSFFDYFSKIPQRPNHMFDILSDKGYPCVFCGNVKDVVVPRANLFVICNKYLKYILSGKFPKIFDVSFSYPYSHIPNFMKYINKNSLVIYELIDDFDLLFDPKIIAQAKQLFMDLIKRENTWVLASADRLYKQAKALGAKNLISSKNAVVFEDFIKSPTDTPKEIQKFKEQGKKIVGYYGAITASWFDFELILNFVKNNQDYAFVLIGLVFKDINFEKTKKYIDELKQYDNFTYIPPIKYEEIPNYAKHWDVATIPFQINEITLGTSPVKLFEYMAMGLPIVTTPMPECKLYKSVHVAKDADGFARKIKTALENKDARNYQTILRQEALDNTWEKRVDDIIKIIDENYRRE